MIARFLAWLNRRAQAQVDRSIAAVLEELGNAVARRDTSAYTTLGAELRQLRAKRDHLLGRPTSDPFCCDGDCNQGRRCISRFPTHLKGN